MCRYILHHICLGSLTSCWSNQWHILFDITSAYVRWFGNTNFFICINTQNFLFKTKMYYYYFNYSYEHTHTYTHTHTHTHTYTHTHNHKSNTDCTILLRAFNNHDYSNLKKYTCFQVKILDSAFKVYSPHNWTSQIFRKGAASVLVLSWRARVTFSADRGDWRGMSNT